MAGFEAKASPTDEKLRGGYYTPAPIAEFVSDWVACAGSVLLEPACGDGNILAYLAKHTADAVGVELFPEEAARASERTGLSVATGDFFRWFTGERHGSFDGVAGNPPYIRFGHWAEPSRETALSFMRSNGLHPNKLTNAWVPFVMASVVACRPGGRIGLVVPAELMQVGYASELRQYLIDNCSAVTVVCFRRLVFPGILQEVVLLLAVKGEGPARIQVLEVDDAASLAGLQVDTDPKVRAPLHEREKWTKYFLQPQEVETLRTLRSDDRLAPLERFASVDVGVVTGRNSYFVMTSAEAQQHKVEDLTIPLVSRSNQLSGIKYNHADHQDYRSDGGKVLLLDARGVALEEHPGLAAYVRLGEEHEVHTGYKCRIRKQWWVVPSIWQADAFMLRQIHAHPRIVANETKATSTDTVHRMRMREGINPAKLAACAMNSVTFAFSEVVGRSYGGGLLELEPSEAEELPIPDPSLLPEHLVAVVDQLVRHKRIEEAVDAVDQSVLIGKLGFTPAEVDAARTAWRTLRDRRMRRGKTKDPN
ncbi:class I SAM-dependent methyltransferase [Micromonospora sp. NPDC051196]|uniref:class I SAM-dependent methyltransferase n=1 Tax=Micromonospora sp. NPDC051196 TaxID=3155281 RepID=UPI0034385073